MSQPSYLKLMLYVALALLLLGVLWYLTLARNINPDRFFVQKLGAIAFTELYVKDFKGGINIIPGVGERYMYASNGKIRYSASNYFPFYDIHYKFDIDENQNFTITKLATKQNFVLGKVIDKRYDDYDGSHLYTIRVPKEYEASFTYTLGRMPYYVNVQMTMMSSGGMKYSSQTKAVIKSQEGKYLMLSHSTGHLPPIEKTGIYSLENTD
ncbi:hypothetical protein GTQ34_03485 [Muricauda sp. JGD-17]|uniref:Uncharacterized protein n=1 Tax=Flagellimonas ochracea TaxID=2696472 RepID=A0A964T9Z0_9FLAO|nr:hypothetical protein [Allomuricauda ochracea]NAY90972.1 hypothetical protein [Allomuricauda ochracea]